MFSYIYSQALAMATQIIVGFLIGAGDLDAVEQRVWKNQSALPLPSAQR